MFAAIVSVLLAAGPLAAAWDAAAVRKSAQKSVALLEKVTAQWKTPCVSCHHQVMPALAFEAARNHGIAVDEAGAKQFGQKTFQYLSDLDEAVQVTNLIDPAVSEGYALLGAHAAGVAPNPSTAAYARHIARFQRADGHWPIFDARPPASDGPFVATAVALRAISVYLPARLGAEKTERLERARRWLNTAKPESTEDLTYRVLGLLWAAAPAAETERAAKELASAQRPDGGWGQVASMPESDAYSTAQALVALRRAGAFTAQSPGFARGVDWLLRRQAADGSWQVKSRIETKVPVSPPYFESGFPYGHHQYLSCAATAWAVMALAEALPAAGKSVRPLPLEGVAPAGVAPWMELALFGSAADVAGLNPSLATAGGTTVLMMAADQPAKVRALLAKGAKATAAAKTGVDALLVASLYPGNTESVRVLLDAGASARLRPNVKFKGSALPFAVFTGDVSMVSLLIDGGADPNVPFTLLGQFPMAPLVIAQQMDDAAMVGLLVKRGAKLEATDSEGMSALSWAALNHKNNALRALLAAGARRNLKDKFGLTPLGHTAGITHMSPETARLLRE